MTGLESVDGTLVPLGWGGAVFGWDSFPELKCGHGGRGCGQWFRGWGGVASRRDTVPWEPMPPE